MSVQSALHVVYYAVGLLVGLVVHEFAHAWTAVRLGDQTPRLAGRLTLNPRPHVDPFGTLVLPGILLLVVLFGFPAVPFAYAKPQELSPWSVRRDRNVAFIALAGPVANVLVAFVVGGILRALGPQALVSGQVGVFLADVLVVNVFLAAMNLMPIPPLDMSRVVALVLPPRAREVMTNLQQYGALFVLLIFFIFPGPILTFARAIANGICVLVAGGACF